MEVADKKVALFEAVIALIEDGVDINSLKYPTLPTGPELAKAPPMNIFGARKRLLYRRCSMTWDGALRRSAGC